MQAELYGWRVRQWRWVAGTMSEGVIEQRHRVVAPDAAADVMLPKVDDRGFAS